MRKCWPPFFFEYEGEWKAYFHLERIIKKILIWTYFYSYSWMENATEMCDASIWSKNLHKTDYWLLALHLAKNVISCAKIRILHPLNRYSNFFGLIEWPYLH